MKKILLYLFIINFLSSCASQKKGLSPNTPNTPPPPVDTNNHQTALKKNSVALKIVSTQRLSDYAQEPLNNPTNVVLTVSLKNNGAGLYSGDIEITYTDSGQEHEGFFSTNADAPKMNKWIKVGGNKMFQSLFEDDFGAVSLIIDEVIDLGDGVSSDLVNGSIWFKNHGWTGAPPNSTGKHCWEIEMGPYDCRADFIGNPIYPDAKNDDDSSASPTEYYKLGKFTGLSLSAVYEE